MISRVLEGRQPSTVSSLLIRSTGNLCVQPESPSLVTSHFSPLSWIFSQSFPPRARERRTLDQRGVCESIARCASRAKS